jgi:hypothetical protein
LSSLQVLDPDTNEFVALFHPHRQKWIEHSAWSEDSTKIMELTAIGRAIVMTLKMNSCWQASVLEIVSDSQSHSAKCGQSAYRRAGY